jgi:hypothetical protein
VAQRLGVTESHREEPCASDLVVLYCGVKMKLHSSCEVRNTIHISWAMAPLEITGNVRNRFVQAAVLLHMLDPIRGEPTAYGLDQDVYDIETPRERLLKRKFLDSFALICAKKPGGDSVSAACIEEGSPQGTVIRIASNAGVQEGTLIRVRELVDTLNSVAKGGTLPLQDCMQGGLYG